MPDGTRSKLPNVEVSGGRKAVRLTAWLCLSLAQAPQRAERGTAAETVIERSHSKEQTNAKRYCSNCSQAATAGRVPKNVAAREREAPQPCARLSPPLHNV